MKRVTILHTTPVTIQSLHVLTQQWLPEAAITNLLDDSILPMINEANAITDSIRGRFDRLVDYAVSTEPDALLCACSSVGGMFEDRCAMHPVKALRIDTPMAQKAISLGRRIGIMATLPSTLGPTMALISRIAREANQDIVLTPLLVEGAGALLKGEDIPAYEALIADSLLAQLDKQDVIVLAQASMSGAACKVASPIPVLSSPESGILQLRQALAL